MHDAHSRQQQRPTPASGTDGAARAVDIVIVSFNGCDLLRACLQSIAVTCGHRQELAVTVVDNASQDGSADMVRDQFPQVQLIPLECNIGFGPANNRGFVAGSAPYVLFLNSDAELTPGALDTLVTYLDEHPRCAIVGPALRYPDGSFQPSCRRFPSPMRDAWSLTGFESRVPQRFRKLRNWLSEAEHQTAVAVDMVSGACFLLRRPYLECVGGFDENLFLYEEEMDISFPARRLGYEVHHLRDAEVIHHHGGSSQGQTLQEFTQFHAFRSKYYCFRKHYGPARASLTYLANRAVFAISTAKNKITGTPSPAPSLLKLAKHGYTASKHLTTPTTRKAPTTGLDCP
jgi:N-acetylglucosaminyl-diphospho-decaprenol L-rhamnosyltransferase